MDKWTKELIKIMEAFLEGKDIEYRLCNGDKWHNLKNEPLWNLEEYEYRIKKEDEYVPYEDTVEMVKDYCKRTDNILVGSSIPIIWIKDKNDKGAYLISAFYEKGVSLFNSQIGVDLKVLFDNYTYIDGSPIGRKDE